MSLGKYISARCNKVCCHILRLFSCYIHILKVCFFCQLPNNWKLFFSVRIAYQCIMDFVYMHVWVKVHWPQIYILALYTRRYDVSVFTECPPRDVQKKRWVNHKLFLSFRISFSIFRQKDNLNSKDCLPNDDYIIIIILRNYYTYVCSTIHATSSTQHRTFPFIYQKLFCHTKKSSTCRFLKLQYL